MGRSLLVPATLVACSPDIAAIGDSDTEDTTGGPATSTAEPATGSTAVGPQPVCTPGQTRCEDPGLQQTCAQDGQSWTDEPCSQGYECVACEQEPCEGDLCRSPCELAELEALSSAGCSFLAARQLGLQEILGPLYDIPEEQWAPDGLLLLNPSELPATVQLHDLAAGSIDPQPLGDPFTLPAGGAEIFDLSTQLPFGEYTTRRAGAMVWVESDVPIVAYTYSPTPPFLGNDSSMLLPETSLGRHYVVPSYPPHYLQHQGAGHPTYFDLIATKPGTKVRWLAQFTQTYGNGVIVDPVPAGQWSAEYNVGRYEGLRVTADFAEGVDPHAADTSGIVIEASEPVYVIGGSRCSAVPAVHESSGCDPLTEVLIPLEQWGPRYVVPHPPLRDVEEHYYRIYGADPGVTVSTTPPVLGTPSHEFTSRGAYIDVVVPHGTSFVAEADGPVMVVGYLTSRQAAGGLGDPAMYQHVPVAQARRRYAIGAPAKWDEQYVQITRQTGNADVTVNGTVVESWQAVGSYETTTITVEPGVHILDSDAPFTAIQFAYNNSEGDACSSYDPQAQCHSSYAHPVGMRTEALWSP